MVKKTATKLSLGAAISVIALAIMLIFLSPLLVSCVQGAQLRPTTVDQVRGPANEAVKSASEVATGDPKANVTLTAAAVNSSTAPTVTVKTITEDTFTRDLGTVSTFYQTIIQILLAALAIVAAIGLWSINMISKTAAEDIVKDFLASQSFDREFRNRLDSAVQASLGAIRDDINDLRENISLIRQEMDEEVVGDGNGHSAEKDKN